MKPKFEKQLLAKEEGEKNVTTDTLLHKYASYWKLLRVTAFVRCFIENCRKGEMHYKIKKSVTAKAYIALITCASTRAVHLKLCRDLSATEFQTALRELVARQG